MKHIARLSLRQLSADVPIPEPWPYYKMAIHEPLRLMVSEKALQPGMIGAHQLRFVRMGIIKRTARTTIWEYEFDGLD